MFKRTAIFIRDRLEGVLFLLLFPLWLLIAAPAAAFGRTGRELSFALRRWQKRIGRGLTGFRSDSWVSWKLERKRDIWFHFLITEFFAALNLARRRALQREIPPAGRVLVVKLAHFGDALHVLPMLRGLHMQRPDLQIDLLVGPWCKFLGGKTDGVQNLFTYTPRYTLFNRGQKSGTRSFLREIAFLFALRRRRYDLVISTSTTTLPELLLIQALGPEQWIGCSTAMAGRYPEVPGHLTPYDARMYESDRVCRLLEPVRITVSKTHLLYPLSEERVAWGREQRKNWLGGNHSFLVAISPGAGWPGKQWILDRFSAVAKILRDQYSAVIVLLGTPAERDLTAKIAADMGRGVMNLGGKTTLDELAAVIASADLFIGNDSGPMHLAAAFDTPSISLFGPTIASKWAPRGAQHRFIQKDYPCTGCWSWHSSAKCIHDGACMKLIEVAEVVECAAALLKEPGRGVGEIVCSEN